MKTSLIITTYNWKEALAAVLESVKKQTVLPNEVIIADDGSREDTANLIKEYQQIFPVPLIHSWIEDKGFRAALSRNKALAIAQGDYLIIIDGDIVLPVSFIDDHIKNAKKGRFIQGGRVLFNEQRSNIFLSNGILPNIFEKGLKNRKNIIHSKILSRLFSRISNTDKSTRSCNMSFWKEDVIAVNGFNNDFIGWGREDSEFVIRLLNSGLNRMYLKFMGVGYHIYHPENSKNSLVENDLILETTIKSKLTRCINGIDKFI